MLGNISDFRAEEKPAGIDPVPVLYASADTTRHKRVRRSIGADKCRRVAQPKSVAEGVPNVVGYGVRDAIRTLEGAGYNVDFEGRGCVARQQPAAGHVVKRGSKCILC